MKYDIFKAKHQILCSNKQFNKAFTKVLGHVPTFEDVLIHDTNVAIEMNDVLGANTNAEEYFWYRTGKKLVFVNQDVISMLNRAKFSGNIDSKILPPDGFDTFALCFEQNTRVEVNGERIRLYPMQITVLRESEIFDKIHKPFYDLTGHKFLRNNDLDIAITVSYKVGQTTFRSCVDVSEVMDKITTGLELSDDLSDIYDQSLNDKEQLQTNLQMRIAVQLLIFNAATENKYLVDGFPEQSKFQLPNNTIRTYWKASHFNYKPNNHAIASHIRSAHFRNLRDDRYYKGQYENLEKGSRWTLVSESFVGGNETFTQNIED
ncbi:hypothetical protein L7E35_004683 [Vibrio parahaemolyticus]|nr:hypothetical protein [Vibrio parahaemolyticus]EIV1599737.1 hypothetical protein [Vibrio parahaemolyticus]